MGVPQSAQNRPMAGAPHAGQPAARGVPHEGQKRAAAGIASPQVWHVGTAPPLRFGL